MFVVGGPSDDPSPECTYTDDYVENFDTGITITVTQASSIVSVKFSTTNTGVDASLRYTVSYLN